MKTLLSILIAGILFTSCNSGIPKGKHSVTLRVHNGAGSYDITCNVPDSLTIGDTYTNYYGERGVIVK